MPQLATICYIDNGKELLMLHRNKKPNDVHEGKWIGVGGKLERGETPQECAAREILEETGLKAKPVLKGVITFPEFTPDLDWYTYVFKVTEFEGDLIDCNEGIYIRYMCCYFQSKGYNNTCFYRCGFL